MQSGTTRLAAVISLLFALAFPASIFPASAAERNAAGIVVQYGDGSRVYAYVQFSEESISSEELLTRTGIDVVVAPFGGMGAAVCSIDGEGCPSSSCWCQSYSNPAYFWHFYALQDGQWVEQLRGMSARTVSNGDVDGWLWTAGDTSLPDVSLDEIARVNGIDPVTGAPGTSTPAIQPAIDTLFVPAGASMNTADTDSSQTSYLLFGIMLLAVLTAATVVVIRQRSRISAANEPSNE